MSKICIEINTDNAAFDGTAGAEVAEILRTLAARLEHIATPAEGAELEPFTLSDFNGNTVGRAHWEA